MKNELTTIQKYLIKTIDKNGISDIIKPLIKEIEIQDIYVSGTLLIKKSNYINLCKGQELVLKRDLKNKFYDFAVEIGTKDGKKLGYVSEEYSQIYARLIEAGKVIIGKIKKMNLNKEPYSILVTLFLKDF